MLLNGLALGAALFISFPNNNIQTCLTWRHPHRYASVESPCTAAGTPDSPTEVEHSSHVPAPLLRPAGKHILDATSGVWRGHRPPHC